MHGRTDVLITVSFVSSVLSALGSLFIISNWLLFPSRRLFFTKLIVCLSVANLISSAAYSLSFFSRGSVDASNALCRTQAVLTITFEMASVLWTVAIAWTLYTMVVLKAARVERQERWYHAGCWGVPAAVAVVLLATDALGPADREEEWCWISGMTPRSRWLQVGLFYIPLVVAFGVSALVYLRVGRAFRQLAVAGAVDAGKEWMVQLRLRLYLLVFVLVWLVPVVDSTVQLCAPSSPFWLQSLHAATGGRIMGLLNSLVYGCNDKTLQPYRLGATRLRQRLASLPASLPAARSAPGACAGAAATPSSFSEALLPAGAASTPPQQQQPRSPSPPLPPPSDPDE